MGNCSALSKCSGTMSEDTAPLIAFYGDDLTGSTDAMEALELGGVDTALFLNAPNPEDLTGRFAGLDAVGVAGTSRSMSPERMDEVLPSQFERLDALDPTVVQYKVCSTFDSSPAMGSIGHATDLAQAVFDSPFVPVVVGSAALERYVVFGHLFATADGTTYRIDRHPTMSEHPTTPMAESDLGRHLGEQTDREVDRFTVLELDDPGVDAAFARFLAEDSEIVLFDTLDNAHLQTVGRLVWSRAIRGRREGPMFVVGSSGFDYALTSYLNETGEVEPPESVPQATPTDRIVVTSGSASPETATQIERALDSDDFVGVRLRSERLVRPEAATEEYDRAVEAALDVLDGSKSVVLYTARGPDDPAIERTRDAASEADIDDLASRLGRAQGRILRRILLESDVNRTCVAGGDTSGYVVPELDIDALEFHSPLAPGSPLCLASSTEDELSRLEITLKGGQTGGERFFENVQQGRTDYGP